MSSSIGESPMAMEHLIKHTYICVRASRAKRMATDQSYTDEWQ
jgi:hypothetical protein